jgi:hypothetical protein
MQTSTDEMSNISLQVAIFGRVAIIPDLPCRLTQALPDGPKKGISKSARWRDRRESYFKAKRILTINTVRNPVDHESQNVTFSSDGKVTLPVKIPGIPGICGRWQHFLVSVSAHVAGTVWPHFACIPIFRVKCPFACKSSASARPWLTLRLPRLGPLRMRRTPLARRARTSAQHAHSHRKDLGGQQWRKKETAK